MAEGGRRARATIGGSCGASCWNGYIYSSELDRAVPTTLGLRTPAGDGTLTTDAQQEATMTTDTNRGVGPSEGREANDKPAAPVSMPDLPLPDLPPEQADGVRGGALATGAQVQPSQKKVTVAP